MDDQATKKAFPPAMLDMGMPNEMTLPVLDSEAEETPMLEITQPLDIEEPKEIRDAGSVTLL